MREILFRGKRTDNGEWVDGYLIIKNGNRFIVQNDSDYWHPVIPETVGQFTGLKDKNGVKIFEGDVLEFEFSQERFVVEFNTKTAQFNAESTFWLWSISDRCKVIGNIHDNPELVEAWD